MKRYYVFDHEVELLGETCLGLWKMKSRIDDSEPFYISPNRVEVVEIDESKLLTVEDIGRDDFIDKLRRQTDDALLRSKAIYKIVRE